MKIFVNSIKKLWIINLLFTFIIKSSGFILFDYLEKNIASFSKFCYLKLVKLLSLVYLMFQQIYAAIFPMSIK